MLQGNISLVLLGERWQELLKRRSFWIVFNLIVVISVSSTLTQRAWTLFEGNHTIIIPSRRAQAAASSDETLKGLLNAYIFGRDDAQSGGAASQIAPTSLNIALTGVIAAPEKSAGIALLSVDGKPEEAFQVGGEIVAGTALLEVLSDRIIIERGGQREMVLLPGAEESLLATMLVPAGDSMRQSSTTNRPAKNDFVVVRQDISKQVQSPQELLSQAVLVPNSGGGFLLKEVQSGSLIEQYGLRPGDIVRSANGQALNYADDIQRVYRQLADVRHVKLELYRDGNIEELNYQIK